MNLWKSCRTMKVSGFETPPPGAGVKTVRAVEVGTARSLPKSVTFRWVLSTYTVGRLEPLNCPTEPRIKCWPVRVTCRSLLAAPWLNTLARLKLLRVATAFWPGGATVNEAAFDVPPPGAPVATVTLETPGWLTNDCGSVVCRWPLLTKVVGRAAPFHLMVEPLMKLVP